MKKTILLFTVLCAASAVAQDPGDPNAAFGNQGIVTIDASIGLPEVGNDVLVQPDGKVVVAATHEDQNGMRNIAAYRLNPDGSLDVNFNYDGIFTLDLNDDDVAVGIARQSDGKILLLGQTEDPVSGVDIVIHRLNADGTTDNTFGTNGTLQLDRSNLEDDFGVDIAVTPDNKIWVGGVMNIAGNIWSLVYRFLPNGDADSTYSLDGSDFTNLQSTAIWITCFTVAPDGSSYFGGYKLDNGAIKMYLQKRNASGYLDNSFNLTGEYTFTITANTQASLESIIVQPDGKLVGVGAVNNLNTNEVSAQVFRLGTNNLLDPSFGPGGYANFGVAGRYETFTDILLIDGGKMVLSGQWENGNGVTQSHLLQLTPAGVLDTSYGVAGMQSLSLPNEQTMVAIAANATHVFSVGTIDQGGLNLDVIVTSTHVDNSSFGIGILDQPQKSVAVHVFPNPIATNQELSFCMDESLSGSVDVEILSLTGVLVHRVHFDDCQAGEVKHIQLPQMARGIYLVKASCGGNAGVQKLIVE